jgi:Trk K+ transport system NAD-binding subunit
MMLAGASAVYTPRHVLGAALAARASERIGPTVAGIQQLGKKLRTMDVRIQPTSPLAGKTLGEAGIGRLTGATVLAQWVGGELVTPPDASTVLEPGGILVIAGGEESLHAVEELCEGTTALRGEGPFIIGGYGEVGRKVAQLLRDAGEEIRVIDRLPDDGVDIVGDVLDGSVFEPLDLQSSRAVILALDSDTATLFATVIVKDLAPGVPVIARVNQAENLDKIHRAGADFALSLSQVAGQILGRRLLGEDAISIDTQVKLLRVSAAGLVGKGPADAEIRDRTGCSVVAIQRGEELLVNFGPDFRFEEGDEVYVSGSSQEIRRFKEAFPQD